MAGRTKIEAFVLARRHIGEADRLVTFFTKDRGIVRAVAKGVRKIPSSRGGHLEPFSKVLALISESRAGAYVGAVETLDYFLPLKQQEQALHHASNMAVVLTQLFNEDQPQLELYHRYMEACDSLPQLPLAKQRLLESVFIMLSLQRAGLMPDLRVCQTCDEAKPSEAVVFNGYQGGWKCLSCHNTLQGAEYSLSPRLLAALRFITNKPSEALRLKIANEESNQLLQAVRKCVADVVDSPLLMSA